MTASAERTPPLVLLIDDDPWLRTVMAEVLRDGGFQVREAADGAQGLALAQHLGPDVILLDLALPGRSGLQVLHTLKDAHPTRNIPVVIVSAYALLLLRGDLQTVAGVVQKPFDLTDLVAQVKQAAVANKSGGAAGTSAG